MKSAVINFFLHIIKQGQPDINNDEIDKIKYGLESIYILITKMIVIIFLAYILNITDEVFIFIAIYSLIRLPSFGLHASKSWACLITSIVMFIDIPLVCIFITIPVYIKLFLGLITVILIYLHAPADTYKRPIINVKKRRIYKYLSTLIAIVMALLSLVVKNNYIANTLILSLVLQTIIIDPNTYKLFNLPYDNYKGGD